MDIKICFYHVPVIILLPWLFCRGFYYIPKIWFLSISCISDHKPFILAAFDVSHVSIHEIFEKISHENHDDWTQLQVARAGSGRSCVSLSSRIHPLLSSRSPSTLPHVSPFRPRESAQDPPMLCTSLRVSWQVYTRIFFPPTPPRRSVTQPPLSFASLSTRPHPKEIKPHLTRWLSLSRTTVVLRGERSWNELVLSLSLPVSLSFFLLQTTQKPRPERRDEKIRERTRWWGRWGRPGRFAKWRTSGEDDRRLAPPVRAIEFQFRARHRRDAAQ